MSIYTDLNLWFLYKFEHTKVIAVIRLCVQNPERLASKQEFMTRELLSATTHIWMTREHGVHYRSKSPLFSVFLPLFLGSRRFGSLLYFMWRLWYRVPDFYDVELRITGDSCNHMNRWHQLLSRYSNPRQKKPSNNMLWSMSTEPRKGRRQSPKKIQKQKRK